MQERLLKISNGKIKFAAVDIYLNTIYGCRREIDKQAFLCT